MFSFCFKDEGQWQEIVRDDYINDALGGAVMKGPTMPTQADLEQIVDENFAKLFFLILKIISFFSLCFIILQKTIQSSE